MTSWLILAGVAVLSAILLWGVVAPRTQWRVLFGWSAPDPDASEPGDALHGLRRAIAALGLLGVLVVAGLQLAAVILDRPLAAPEPSSLERMWGTPTPGLVDRVVHPVAEAPAAYVPGTLHGYQPLTRGYPPNYLAELPRYAFLGEPSPAGLVGSAPVEGFAGYGSGDILLAVEGPLGCVPRVVVAAETETAVELAVYWGLPGASDQDHAAGCEPGAPVTQTVLLPVQLSESVGERLVVSAGVPLAEVRGRG